MLSGNATPSLLIVASSGPLVGHFGLVSDPRPQIHDPGDVHKRQRRAMTPAFGLAEAKALLPVFARSADRVGSASNWAQPTLISFTAGR